MENKKRFSMPVTGGSSLLVIFAVLALTIFAILSISTVKADQKLAEKASSSVEAFYQADCEAERILAQLRQGIVPAGVTEEGNIYSYHCPVSETQELAVKIRLNGTDYEVLQWQLVSSAEWKNDERLPVWDGEVIIEENEFEGEGIWPL